MKRNKTIANTQSDRVSYILPAMLGLLMAALLSPPLWISHAGGTSPRLLAIIAQTAGALIAVVAVVGVFGMQTCQAVAQAMYGRFYSQLERLIQRSLTAARWIIRLNWPKGLDQYRSQLAEFLDAGVPELDIKTWAGFLLSSNELQVLSDETNLFDLDAKRLRLEKTLAHLHTSPPTRGSLKDASSAANEAVGDVLQIRDFKTAVDKTLLTDIEMLKLNSSSVQYWLWLSLSSLAVSLLLCLGAFIALRRFEFPWTLHLAALSALSLGIGTFAGCVLLQRVRAFSRKTEE